MSAVKLEYENIYACNNAENRLKSAPKRNSSYRWARGSTVTEDEINNDRLTIFTVSAASKDETQYNVDTILEYAQSRDCQYAVIKSNQIQLIGSPYKPTFSIEVPEPNSDRARYWYSRSSHIEFQGQEGTWVESYWTYNDIFVRTDTQKIYEVESGKVLKRRDAIQKFWDAGFVTLRGRPVTAASRNECGYPSEIARMQNLASEMQYDVGNSEVALKIYQAWKSLKKNYAWPGTW